MDGRIEAYPDATQTSKREIGNLKDHWTKHLADDGVDAIVAAQDRAFAGLIELMPGWSATATSDGAVLYERVRGAR
jgi:hypothetical protein